MAVRVSCTITITGLFDCGEITCKLKLQQQILNYLDNK